MGIVGLAAVLAGGCPMRQLILAGEGNTDAAATVFGLVFGAALMHNFGWAASPAGVSVPAKYMVVVVWLLLLGALGMGSLPMEKTTSFVDKVKACPPGDSAFKNKDIVIE
jgi:uncharacterized protein